jgi:hypothetical protein
MRSMNYSLYNDLLSRIYILTVYLLYYMVIGRSAHSRSDALGPVYEPLQTQPGQLRRGAGAAEDVL